MLPVSFENFFEQGASTVNEVLWGVQSPQPAVEKDKGTILRTSAQQQQHLQRQGIPKSKTTSNSFFRTPGKTIPRHGNSQFQQNSFRNTTNNVQGTPTTEVDDSWGNESSISDPHSILASSSSSSSESATRKRRLPNRSWKYPSGPKNNNKGSKNSSNTRGLSNISINIGSKKQHKLKNKLESGSRSIDEIFGYNTKQKLTKTKSSVDEDVGLDFMILDIPLSKNGLKKRSLLIVQNIDPKGLFAKTDLGVGDAILSINGTSFENQKKPRYGRITGTRGISSEKPNLFRARALLNGRGRSVTIEYQKFGETNSSVCTPPLVKPHQYQQQQQNQPQDETNADMEPLLPSQPQQANSRRSSSTRVDFLGMLRPTKSNGKKGKSMTPKGFSDAASSSSSEDDELYRQSLGEPPRISRMTRLKARSLNYGTTENKDKDVDNNNIKNQETMKTPPDSPTLPYRSYLDHGPEEQIELLKQRVNSSKANEAANSPTSSEVGIPKPLAHSPARSAFSASKLSDGSPARSTRSDSYLQDLRKTLSPTANAILADLSVGMADFSESTMTKSDEEASMKSNTKNGQLIPPTSNLSEGNQRDMIRINRKVVEKLQLRVEFLKKNNMELRNEVTAFKRNADTNCQKLVQAEKQLEQKDAMEQKYKSELDLLKSRLDISTIQADKRHRELLESKEKSIADNDKVISNLSKRIEGLEKANAKLIEQLKKLNAKRQEKQSNLQAQFDRLKMKFSAQSTLLDNVMTSNEELTSQNEAMESELHAYSVAAAAKVNTESNHSNNHKPPLHTGFTTTGMLFAEGSESELEHIKRDPILLAQAKELSSCKERNSHLEDQVESLSKQLAALSAKVKSRPSIQTIKSGRSSATGRSRSETTPSLLDVTLTSSEDDAVDAMSTKTHGSTEREEPDHDPNVSVDNPSDEEGFLPRDASINRTNTFRLEYQHTFDNRDDLDQNVAQDDETVSTSNHSRNRQHQTQDESFESVSSLVLMERILELETALQKTDLEPEDSQRFLLALQSRISKLTERGYEKVANINLAESNES